MAKEYASDGEGSTPNVVADALPQFFNSLRTVQPCTPLPSMCYALIIHAQ